MQDKNKIVEKFIKERVGQGIIDAFGDGISIQDTDLNILYQNKVHKEIIGDHQGEICYKAYEKREQICDGCPVVKSFLDGEAHTTERTATTDKGIITVEITASPLRDLEGVIIAGVEIVRDVTAKKELQHNIIQAKKDWEDTFDVINEAITIHDKDFNIIRANRAAEKMLKLPFTEMFSQKCFESYHGCNAPPEKCPSCQTLKTGEPTLNEFFEPHLNKYLEIKALPRFDENQQQIGIVHVVRDITKRKKMEEELHALTLTDELTHLYNRRGFMTLAKQQLQIANRLKRNVQILYADLDNMKHINDAYGHKEGDLVLIEMAEIFKKVFRASDIIARVGGDEFVVFLIENIDISSEGLNERIQASIDDHNARNSRDYKLSISLGIVTCEYKCTYSIEELMSQADKLMYEQKKQKLIKS